MGHNCQNVFGLMLKIVFANNPSGRAEHYSVLLDVDTCFKALKMLHSPEQCQRIKVSKDWLKLSPRASVTSIKDSQLLQRRESTSLL